jgi:cbb3-type cytochrome oxidase subunit 3
MNFIQENAPIIGTLFFFSIFILVIINVFFSKKLKKNIKEYAKMPLEDSIENKKK